MVKIPRFHCRGSIPGQGTKIPHAAQRGQKKKKEKRSGELSSHGRGNNCKDPKTEEFGMLEGLQSSKCLEPSRGGVTWVRAGASSRRAQKNFGVC